MQQGHTAVSGNLPDIDQRDAAWYIDKVLQFVVFVGGISAIILIIGIFTFVTIEGFGFLLEGFSFKEFFLSPWWEPTDEDEPTYGILALIAGTASVTGLAMIVAIPFSLGAAIYIGEFSTGKTRVSALVGAWFSITPMTRTVAGIVTRCPGCRTLIDDPAWIISQMPGAGNKLKIAS